MRIRIIHIVLAFLPIANTLAAQSSQGSKALITHFTVTPSVFFTTSGDTLKHLFHATIENTGKPVQGEIILQIKKNLYTAYSGLISSGKGIYSCSIPDTDKSVSATWLMKAGNETHKYKATISPQRKWTIYLFHHSHSDIGYTELQTRIARKHAAYLDSVIEYCSQTAHYPEDSRFAWNCEITWSLEQFIRYSSEANIRRLIDLVKEGRVDVSAWYLQMSDLFSHEELIRNIYYAGELSRKYGITITCAMNNDVNGFSWAVPQVLSKAGIKYFATGVNETRSRAPLDRPCAFWWESSDGSRILLWNGEHYLFSNYKLKLHEGVDAFQPNIGEYLEQLQELGDYPYDCIAFNAGAYVTDNAPPGRELPDIVKAWNERWTYPRLKLATMRDFFEQFEMKYGSNIPTYRLGWPDYWTDGVASTAFETGLNRITQDRMRTAETFSAIASSVVPSYRYPAEEFNEAFKSAMLYDEHTWGAHNSISEPDHELVKGQWAIKSTFAYNASEISRHILQESLKALASSIPNEREHAFAVFNPLSWQRTDIVTVTLPEKLCTADTLFRLIDNRTGKDISFQRSGKNSLMFLAENIPSVGYAVYSIAQGPAPSEKAIQTAFTDSTIENNFYRVTVDPVTGGISSIFDKELSCELVDSKSPYKLNQYVYENPEGGRDAVDNMEKRAQFRRYSPSAAQIHPGEKGAVMSSMVITTSSKQCPGIEQTIILYDNLKRIDIVNTLVKEETLTPEAIYYAFPFSVPRGAFLFEIADCFMSPEKDQLPKTTRDWHTVQNWVELSNGTLSIVWCPLEAPLVQFCDINTGKWQTKLDVTNSSLFSYIMNNYWMTNFKASQGGKFRFAYSFTSRRGGSDTVSSTRSGWEFHVSLQPSWLNVSGQGTIPGDSCSFFSIDTRNVLLQTVKQAEDRNGIILRLREIGGNNANVRITSPLFSLQTMLGETDIIERPMKSGPVPYDKTVIPMTPYSIKTLKISRSQ